MEWTEGIARPELTQVRIDGKVVKFHPWQPNTLKVSLFDITPEQAIAATLGSCNCTNDCTNGERTGTCHNVWDIELTGRLRFQCSECGAVSLEITPNFCPVCGRRVEVDE